MTKKTNIRVLKRFELYQARMPFGRKNDVVYGEGEIDFKVTLAREMGSEESMNDSRMYGVWYESKSELDDLFEEGIEAIVNLRNRVVEERS